MGDSAAARFPLNLPAFSSLARLGLADSGSLYGTASQLVLFYNTQNVDLSLAYITFNTLYN